MGVERDHPRIPEPVTSFRFPAFEYDAIERGERLYTEASRIAYEEAPWVFIGYAPTLRGVDRAVVEGSYTASSVGGPVLNTVRLR